jgi:hypothetical protein
MKKVVLPLPELETIAVTRFMLGVGATLLLVHLLPVRHRTWVGWMLLAVGALSTPPLMYDVYVHRIHD